MTAGTDAAEPLVQMGALVGTTLLITLVFLRVLNSMSADEAPSGARAAAAAARAARAATQDETTDAVPTATPSATPTAAAPAPRVAGDAPLDPVLAARLAKLGNRVGRSPQPSAAGGHAAAAEHAGKVDDGEGAGLWAALEAEAIERVALDRRRAEERLRDVELVFAEEGDGFSRP